MATVATRPMYIEEPRLSRWLFGSSQAAWIWLIARIWLGWGWFQAGWTKVFGSNITWRFWNWGDDAYSLTGDGSIGWIRSGTVEGQHTGVAAGRQLTLPTGRRHSVAVLRQVNVRFT